MADKKKYAKSVRSELIFILGQVRVSDVRSPEEFTKIQELHTMLKPEPRKRVRKAAVPKAATPKEEEKKGFKVSPRPAEEPSKTPDVDL